MVVGSDERRLYSEAWQHYKLYASAQEKPSILEVNVESIIDTPNRDDEHLQPFYVGVPPPRPLICAYLLHSGNINILHTFDVM